MPYLIFPLLFWSSFRFGRRETATAMALISGIAIWGTAHGYGSFARLSEHESLLLLQIFVGLISVGTMAMSAAFEQIRKTERSLSEEKNRIQVTLHSIGDGVIVCDPKGCVSYLNPMAESLTGWSTEDARGRLLANVYCIVDESTRQPLSLAGTQATGICHRCRSEHEPAVLINRFRREHLVQGA